MSFERDMLAGLGSTPKRTSPKYLYDARGSELFEQICELDEYYVTRTELAILESNARDIARRIGPSAGVVELGSGSSIKTELLLRALPEPSFYAPIEISASALEGAQARLSRRFRGLALKPVQGDFTRLDRVPTTVWDGARRKLIFFPGSTLGNFGPLEARRLLRRSARFLGAEGGQLLIGIDLIKPEDVLHAAYNDSKGVTAAFNLNLLERMNRELGAEFELSTFEHQAWFNRMESRIEMHLVSLKDQWVRVGPRMFWFSRGETIHTESSYKHAPAAFERMCRDSGFRMVHAWTDPKEWFGVYLLEAAPTQELRRSA